MAMLTVRGITVPRVASAPRGAGPKPAAFAAPRPSRLVRVRYTSQTGRTGEGGQEEEGLRDTLKKRSSEQQYGGTQQTTPGGVDEEKQPGFYHEDRQELERMGAVVHEVVAPHKGPTPTPQQGGSETRSAPESGTEGRTGGSGPRPSSRSDEDVASAPESGTR